MRLRPFYSGRDGLNKGLWSPEEDFLLTKFIESNGEGRWRAVPKKAGLKRCGKSCRLRWVNYLRPNVKRGNFSPDEEELTIRLHKLLGNRWSLIARRMPGRTDNEVKNYWNTRLSKKAASNGSTSCKLQPNGESPRYNNNVRNIFHKAQNPEPMSYENSSVREKGKSIATHTMKEEPTCHANSYLGIPENIPSSPNFGMLENSDVSFYLPRFLGIETFREPYPHCEYVLPVPEIVYLEAPLENPCTEFVHSSSWPHYVSTFNYPEQEQDGNGIKNKYCLTDMLWPSLFQSDMTHNQV